MSEPVETPKHDLLRDARLQADAMMKLLLIAHFPVALGLGFLHGQWLVAIVGGAILAGQGWALVAGIVLAILSALMNFVWLPYYPFWAILIIAFDIAVIWALSTMLGTRRH